MIKEVYYCDICHKQFDIYGVGPGTCTSCITIIGKNRLPNNGRLHDICPECTAEIMKTIDRLQTNAAKEEHKKEMEDFDK